MSTTTIIELGPSLSSIVHLVISTAGAVLLGYYVIKY
jgi:hypothetical protein